MKTNNFVIFIPGCFGTSLLKGNETIWPLSGNDKLKIFVKNIERPFLRLFENSHTSENIGFSDALKECLLKLSDKNLIPGKIVSSYDNIIDLIKTLTDNNFFIYSYDWRKSFNELVDDFAKQVDLLDVGDKNITIISHSAGGIIGYKYLCSESKYDTEDSNFSKIKKFIAIGTPIQGCIKALSAILGLLPEKILTSEELKIIVNSGFFQSIYELCPSNLHNLFYYKNTSTSLSNKHIIHILKENGFPEEKIKEVFTFRNEMNYISHNPNLDCLFISGTYTKTQMCSFFYVDMDTKEISCNFDVGCGDGTVLKEESFLDNNKVFRKRHVVGKHSYLTETDAVLKIIEEELTNSFVEQTIILATKVSNPQNVSKLSFTLDLLQDGKRYPIKDIAAKTIFFTHKTQSKNITKKINKTNDNVFYFKTKLPYGMLKFRDFYFTYNPNPSDPESKDINKLCKEVFIEIEEIHDKIVF